jgi:hypothetical protein
MIFRMLDVVDYRRKYMIRTITIACLIVGVLRFGPIESRAGEAVNLAYVDLGYQAVEPYNVGDIVLVNEYIREKMKRDGDDQEWEVYVVPMKYYNRIIFIPLRTEVKLSDPLRKKVETYVDQFLRGQANRARRN